MPIRQCYPQQAINVSLDTEKGVTGATRNLCLWHAQKAQLDDGAFMGYRSTCIGEVDAALALQAWQHAKMTFQQMAISYVGMIMHHDRDSVYTGYERTSQLLLKDRSRLSCALRGAKDNPEMESFNGRFKGEGHSLFLEAQSLDDLIAVEGDRMCCYNTERRYSSIGYVPPWTHVEQMRSDL